MLRRAGKQDSGYKPEAPARGLLFPSLALRARVPAPRLSGPQAVRGGSAVLCGKDRRVDCGLCFPGTAYPLPTATKGKPKRRCSPHSKRAAPARRRGTALKCSRRFLASSQPVRWRSVHLRSGPADSCRLARWDRGAGGVRYWLANRFTTGASSVGSRLPAGLAPVEAGFGNLPRALVGLPTGQAGRGRDCSPGAPRSSPFPDFRPR
jgi:hypothetical protein